MLATEQALNKLLHFEIFRHNFRQATNDAVDMQSCYDIFTHSPSFISMQQKQIPEPSIVLMFTTLQNMVHTIQAAFSETPYHHYREDGLGGGGGGGYLY